MGFLFFHLKPKTSVGGGGRWGGGGGGEEFQPVVVGVGEGEFQPSGGGKSSSHRVGGVGGRRDCRRGQRSPGGGGRGNDERWTATATARLRLAANGLASLDFSSLLGSVYCDFLRSINRFHFLVIYRILGFICWEFKNGLRVWIFCQGNKIIFHASLIVV